MIRKCEDVKKKKRIVLNWETGNNLDNKSFTWLNHQTPRAQKIKIKT